MLSLAAAAITLTLTGCATTQAASEPAPQAQKIEPSAPPQANTMAFPTGDRATSAVLLEKRFPVQIFQGQAFSYEMVVTNLTDLTLENVRISETLPANYTLNTSTPYEAVTGAGKAVWTISSIAPHDSATITVTGVANSGSLFATCAEVTYQSSLCASAPIVSPDIQLNVTIDPSTDICTTVPITYTVVNSGTAVLHNVAVTPAIPNGLQVEGAAPSFSIDQLAPGGTQTFTVNVKPSASGTYEVSPMVTSQEGVSATANAATDTVAPVLAASASSPEQVLIVKTITYTVEASNTGAAPTGATTVSATLPAGTDFIAASGGGIVQGNSVVWNLSSLSPAGSSSQTFTVKPHGVGDYSTSVTVANDCAGTATAATSTRVVGIPALLLEAVDENDPVGVGDNVVYEITITNQGSAPAHNVKLHIELEDTQTYVTSTGDTTAVHDGQTVDFAPISVIPVSGQAVYRVTVHAVSAGDTRFHVTMTADELSRPVKEGESTNLY